MVIDSTFGYAQYEGNLNRARVALGNITTGIEDALINLSDDWVWRGYQPITPAQIQQAIRDTLRGLSITEPNTVSFQQFMTNPGRYLNEATQVAGAINNIVSNPSQLSHAQNVATHNINQIPQVTRPNNSPDNTDNTDYSGETQAEFNARRLAALNAAAEQLGGYGALARDVASGKVSVRDLWANMGASNAYDISPDNWRNLGGWDKNAANGLTAFMNAFNMKYTAPKDGGGDGGGISAPETPSYPTWEEFLKVHPLTKEEVWAKQEQARINTINESVYGTPETGSTGAVGDINELMAARGLLESGATGQALTSLGVTTEKAKEAERLQTANDKAQELKSLTDQYGQGYLSFFNQSVAGAQSAREQAAAIEAAKAAAIFSGAQQDKTNYQNFLYQQQLAAGSKPKFYTTPEFSTQATSGGGGNLLNTLMAGLGLLGGPVGAGISSVFNIASGIFGGGQTAEQKWPSAFTGLNTLLAPTNQTIRNPWQPRSNWGL